MQGFLHCVWPLRMHFWAIFTKKNGYNSVENHCIKKKSKLVLKTFYKKLVLKYHDNARFPSLFGLRECVFKLYFYSINGHNSVEIDRTGKNFTFVLKTIYKKVFLKYQGNARFSSFGLRKGHIRRRKEKKKKSRQAHRGSRRRTGMPQ